MEYWGYCHPPQELFDKIIYFICLINRLMIHDTVHKIVDREDQCVYVGSTTQPIEKRLLEHKCCTRNTPIARAIQDPIQYAIYPLLVDDFESTATMQVTKQQYIDELQPLHNKHKAWSPNALQEAITRYQAWNPDKVKQ